MNIETWFEKGTGFKIKKLRYLKAPQVPYFLYTNKEEFRGADLLNNLVENNIKIERYSLTNKEEDLKDIERVNKFLDRNHYNYECDTDWIDEEEIYGTVWILDPILEKVRKENDYYE